MMKRAKRVLIVWLLMGVAGLWAQNRATEPDLERQTRRQPYTEQTRHRMPREQMARRIKQLQMWKLTERLNLSEEQAMRFFPRYNRYQDDLTNAVQSLQQHLLRLQELQQSDAKDSDIDKEIRAVIEERKNVTDILPKYLNEFREVLTARQTADLILFERDFLRDITEVLERVRERNQKP